ncbi:HlyD family efflux transporter periplasmic adaptor subunit [Phormidesmis priestleyi]|uniref:HlyD family efflux transporter periplasmic adaptor subunit n=1 Tax=Phormidesmis priestleyi TaxID=268141 RepID=UPI000941FC48|nr:HlyD family efflux transporter periplasmic adaptor subunit [Phormidesmis priestleyi]
MTTTNEPNGSRNGNGKRPPSEPAAPAPKRRSPKQPQFSHPLVVQQSHLWSRAIIWTLISVTTLGVLWACFAKIEEVIPAQGKLEPQGAVKDVQVPVNGVVKAVNVKDGQRVQAGELLLTLDPTTSQAQLESLKKVRSALVQENEFYQAQMTGASGSSLSMQIAPQFLSLTKSRASLVAENQLFRAQLDGSTSENLTATQRERLQSNQTELATRTTATRLEAAQFDRQLSQAQVKLVTAKNTLAINQKILGNVQPLAETGAISQIQLLKQQQEVEANQSEVAQLQQELMRLQLAIAGSQTKGQNTLAVDRKDLTKQLSDNHQKIAEIDTQLTKAIVENNKKLAEIDSQISQAQQTLKYGELRAPVAGTVFELKAGTPGFVATSTEPVLKIVPNDSLVAKVSVTNRDIGFIKAGMPVDVRIDSFPFSEFGDVKGTLIWIGSDALPPTQIQPDYTFPAKIRLERQSIQVNGHLVTLQSGMSLSANIKIRKRTVMSIFTDQFTRTSESLTFVR